MSLELGPHACVGHGKRNDANNRDNSDTYACSQKFLLASVAAFCMGKGCPAYFVIAVISIALKATDANV